MAAPVKVAKCFIWLLPVLFYFSCSETQKPNMVSEATPVELPKWTWPIVEEKSFKEKYSLDLRINPFYLQADFDKDGWLDMAMLIKERSSGKPGLIVLRQNINQPEIFGAGQPSTFGTQDWSWLKSWKTEAVLPAGAGGQAAGPVIILFPQDKQPHAPWLFWNGKSWQWQTD